MTTDAQHILSRLLNQELSEEELLQLKKDPELAPMVAIIEETGQWDTPEFSSVENAWERLVPQMKPARISTLRPFFWTAAVAAAIAVFVLIINTPQPKVPQSWRTAAMESKNIVLPDGSTILLNAGSELLLKGDWEDHRSVELHGSALFEVETGKTFSVLTEQGIVEVLGTRFEVVADQDQYAVNCFEGSVSVTSPKATAAILTAGQGVRLYHDSWRDIRVRTDAPSWTTGRATFSSAPIREVLNEFERQFGIEIVYENDPREYTGAFPLNDMDAALELILRPMNLEVSASEAKKIHIRRTRE